MTTQNQNDPIHESQPLTLPNSINTSIDKQAQHHQEKIEQIKHNLDALFNPFIRVVPEKDWSQIKAIWIPFLHHDYNNQLEKSEKIKILEPVRDKFGTVKGYLTAPNENYIPYLTTFFNPTLTQDQVIEKILQAEQNILEIESIVTDTKTEKIIKKTFIGIAKSSMFISLTTDQDNKIINAFPIFHTDFTPEFPDQSKNNNPAHKTNFRLPRKTTSNKKDAS